MSSTRMVALCSSPIYGRSSLASRLQFVGINLLVRSLLFGCDIIRPHLSTYSTALVFVGVVSVSDYARHASIHELILILFSVGFTYWHRLLVFVVPRAFFYCMKSSSKAFGLFRLLWRIVSPIGRWFWIGSPSLGRFGSRRYPRLWFRPPIYQARTRLLWAVSLLAYGIHRVLSLWRLPLVMARKTSLIVRSVRSSCR